MPAQAEPADTEAREAENVHRVERRALCPRFHPARPRSNKTARRVFQAQGDPMKAAPSIR
jgi:hypothetical protein